MNIKFYRPQSFTPHQRTEDDASTHDQVLWAMHTSGLEDLILYVASSDRERNHLCMHVMEIITLMFKEQVCGRRLRNKVKVF